MALKIRRKAEVPYGCPMSKCIGLIGGLWTPEIIWCLSSGPRRFSEIRRHLPSISAKVLSGRLRDLQERAVLERVLQNTHPKSVEYGLTSLGYELLPAIGAIVDVGTKLLLQDDAVRVMHERDADPRRQVASR
jgi:DNA-binding HxlR family transcriptional regulator